MTESPAARAERVKNELDDSIRRMKDNPSVETVRNWALAVAEFNRVMNRAYYSAAVWEKSAADDAWCQAHADVVAATARRDAISEKLHGAPKV